jgi:hypothetical protein
LFLKEQVKASSIEEEEEEDLILPLEHYCRDCGHGGRHRGRRAAPHTSSQSGDVFLCFYVIDSLQVRTEKIAHAKERAQMRDGFWDRNLQYRLDLGGQRPHTLTAHHEPKKFRLTPHELAL